MPSVSSIPSMRFNGLPIRGSAIVFQMYKAMSPKPPATNNTKRTITTEPGAHLQQVPPNLYLRNTRACHTRPAPSWRMKRTIRCRTDRTADPSSPVRRLSSDLLRMPPSAGTARRGLRARVLRKGRNLHRRSHVATGSICARFRCHLFYDDGIAGLPGLAIGASPRPTQLAPTGPTASTMQQ